MNWQKISNLFYLGMVISLITGLVTLLLSVSNELSGVAFLIAFTLLVLGWFTDFESD